MLIHILEMKDYKILKNNANCKNKNGISDQNHPQRYRKSNKTKTRTKPPQWLKKEQNQSKFKHKLPQQTKKFKETTKTTDMDSSLISGCLVMKNPSHPWNHQCSPPQPSDFGSILKSTTRHISWENETPLLRWENKKETDLLLRTESNISNNTNSQSLLKKEAA